ncbi:MAG: patatin-like phospholipase family protein [Bacilli bacterium]
MKRAVVLSGGGSKGAYQIGVWKALKKMHISFDIVTGTSIGSINGLMMVQKEYFKAAHLWRNIGFDDLFEIKFKKDENIIEVYKNFAIAFLKKGGMETSKIYNFLSKSFNEKKFYDSKIDYGIITFNLSSMKPKIIKKSEKPDNLLKYVLASSTCFPAFQITKINETQYIDGGYYDNLPINTAISLGAEEIIAIDLDSIGIKRKLVDKTVKIIYITPRNDLGSFLIFDKTLSRRAMKYGYNDSMKTYNQLDGDCYTFKKGHIFENYNKINVKFINCLKSVLSTNQSDILYKKVLPKNNLFNLSNTTDFNVLNTNILKALEYAGKLLEIDDSQIYSINYYNEMLKKEVLKHESFSKNFIKKIIITKKINRIVNRRAIMIYFYKELQNFDLNRIEILTISNIYQLEFLAAVYIKAIGNQ